MDSSTESITAIIASLVVIVFVIVKYIASRSKNNIDVDKYLSTIEDVIAKVIVETNEVDKLAGMQYASETEYREALLKHAIVALKETADKFGVDVKILENIPEEALSKILNTLIDKLLKEKSVTPLVIKEEVVEENVDERIMENTEEPTVDILSTSEYAKKYNMTTREVSDACKNGQLKATKVSGKWRIEDSAIQTDPVNEDIQHALETFNEE